MHPSISRTPWIRSTRHSGLSAILPGLFFAGMVAAADPSAVPEAVWAIGLPNGYVIMEHQTRGVHVTAEDAARGMVEVRGGSRLIVTIDAPGGYAVDFLNRSAVFRAIGIDGMGRSAALAARGGSLTQQQAAGRHVVDLDYRFALAPGTPSGTYPWPLTLTVRAVGAGNAGQAARERRDPMLSGQAAP